VRFGAGGYTSKLSGLCEHTSTGAEVGDSGPVEPLVFVDDYSHLETSDDTPVDKDEKDRFDDLVEWVRRHGRVGEDVARLVVMTRTGGVSVGELAATTQICVVTSGFDP